MAQPNVAVRPSPFILKMTAGAAAKTPGVTRFLHVPYVQTSPKVQVGKQMSVAR